MCMRYIAARRFMHHVACGSNLVLSLLIYYYIINVVPRAQRRQSHPPF